MKTSSSKDQYDVVIVLGLRFRGRWGLRQDLKQQLDVAAELYRAGRTRRIMVCGRWTIWYDWFGITPPITEAGLMRRYLWRQGVQRTAVILESHSKDTLGNIYYAKLLLRRHPALKRLLVICTAEHQERVAFLCAKFFGSQFAVDFRPVEAPHYQHHAGRTEAVLLAEEKRLLAGVRDGHEQDLHQRLYTRAYYRKQAASAERRIRRYSSN